MLLRNRVRERRLELHLTQRELARRTGLSRQTLSAIERNDGYSPVARVMATIAEALDCSIGDLFWHVEAEAVA